MQLLDGRYEVLAEVSRGPRADVLKARDTQHDRLVALKVCRLDDPASRQQLIAETELLLALPPHPGLATVRYDFAIGDQYVVVLDWVDGIDLGRLLAQRGDPGLPTTSVLSYVQQVAGALDHLHTQQPPIIHGDVKPSNLILTPASKVVLVDFGLAPLRPTRSYQGTAGYVAPEVIAGEPRTPATDVYGLAATTVALLTGSPPRGNELHIPGAADDVASLARTLRRALTTDPRRRPSSASEFAERLLDARRTPWTGVVTFVLVRVHGMPSTEEDGRDVVARVRDRLADIVAEAVEVAGGRVLRSMSDADIVWCVFRKATSAAQLAGRLHRDVTLEHWTEGTSLSLSVAVHSGEAELVDGAYQTPTLDAVRRLQQATPVGRTIVSAASADLIAGAEPAGFELTRVGRLALTREAVDEPVFELLQRGAAPCALVSSTKPPHNLPLQLTSFIGRHAELARLTERLGTNRLCTLVGSAGVGKTRAAIEAARRMLATQVSEAWFVDLSALVNDADVDTVAGQALTAMGLREGGSGTYAPPSSPNSRSNVRRLVEELGDRSALLILDGSEHVREACADLVSRVTVACPRLRIIVASREALGLEGESLIRLPPLEVAPDGATDDELRQSEAVQLFVDRARLQGHVLDENGDSLTLAAALCRQLEGIPSAIELAVGRLKVMSLEQVSTDLHVLGERTTTDSPGGSRGRAPLSGTSELVYASLPRIEQQLLRRLSVFAASFVLGAAEVVCSPAQLSRDEVIAALEALVDKSLVDSDELHGERRFRLLRVTRDSSEARLDEAGERAATEAAFLRWYLTFAEQAESGLIGHDQARWLDRVETELPNLRAAMGLGRVSGAGEHLLLATSLRHFWLVRGHLSEGRSWLVDALNPPLTWPRSVVARACVAWALLACFVGEQMRSAVAARRVLSVSRSVGDRETEALALAVLGLSSAGLGVLDAAEGHSRKAAAVAMDAQALWVAGFALANLGNPVSLKGLVAEAGAIYEESVRIRRELDDSYGLAWSLFRLGLLRASEGRGIEARRLLRESLERARLISYRQGEVLSLLGLAEVSLLSGDTAGARDFYMNASQVARTLEDRAGVALADAGLVEVDVALGDVEEARKRLDSLVTTRVRGMPVTLALLRARAAVSEAVGSAPETRLAQRGEAVLLREMGDVRGLKAILDLINPVSARSEG